MSTEHEDKRKCYCGSPMNIPREDKRLHRYGMNIPREDKRLHGYNILDSLTGYKEWFHYAGTFMVDGKRLAFVLGSPLTPNLEGILGWISFDGKQYSLAGNPEIPGNPKFFRLKRYAKFKDHEEEYYTITYPREPEPGNEYTGTIKGEFPHYQITTKTPELNLTIEMRINPENSPEKSVCTRSVRPLLCGAWFHSGDIAVSLKGRIKEKEIETEGKGWYERNWVHVPIPIPAQWFWFLTFPESGGAFDLLVERLCGWRIHYLDECWLYWKGKFHEFHEYTACISKGLKKAVEERKHSDTIEKRICCKGENGENWFDITAEVTDFRQYEYHERCGSVKWMNPLIKTDGKACIDGELIRMKGSGFSERADITYWWC